SGAPVAERSLEVLKRLYSRVGSDLVIISVGGISTPQQAWERIVNGASLLQGYTGLIYGGPDWIRDIHKGIAAQIRAHGLSNISEAVGSGWAGSTFSLNTARVPPLSTKWWQPRFFSLSKLFYLCFRHDRTPQD